MIYPNNSNEKSFPPRRRLLKIFRYKYILSTHTVQAFLTVDYAIEVLTVERAIEVLTVDQFIEVWVLVLQVRV